MREEGKLAEAAHSAHRYALIFNTGKDLSEVEMDEIISAIEDSGALDDWHLSIEGVMPVSRKLSEGESPIERARRLSG